MEGGENRLDGILEKNNILKDIEMLDLEDGEFVDEQNSQPAELGQSSSFGGGDVANVGGTIRESWSRNQRRRNNKKKNKKKRSSSGTNHIKDMNRFVKDTCNHLKERKSYLIWTAVGLLGVSAVDDLVKEVDAIQVCGGQKTADGTRFRYGGGILWSILKVRDPNAYKEIMKKGKEFERQFKQQAVGQAPVPRKGLASQGTGLASTDQTPARILDGSQLLPDPKNPLESSSIEHKGKPVHDRIRVPVAYDDLLGYEDPKEESA